MGIFVRSKPELLRIVLTTLLFLTCVCAVACEASDITLVKSVADLRAGDFGNASDVMLAGYFGDNTPGGGILHRDASDTVNSDNGCTIFRDSGGHRFKRLAGPLSVQACGARGDGTTDDTAAEGRALAAVPSGGRLEWPKEASSGCYLTTASLRIIKPVTISGEGTICLKTAGIGLLVVTASNVTVENIALTGPQFTTYHGNEDAIRATGVFHPGHAPKNIKKFTVRNLRISGFGAAAIQGNYIDGFTITGNNIRNLPYAGIMILSGINGEISGNAVSNITGNGSPGLAAYGIALSRYTDDPGDLISQPRSAFVVIKKNTIEGVPTWEGLDTHAGAHLKFLDNKVHNSLNGVSVGPARNSARRYSYAPLDVTVSGNVVDSGVMDGSRGTGIPFAGAPDQERATGVVSDNRITGYGDASIPADGAIRTYTTQDVSITGNVIVAASPNGIVLDNDNAGMTISGNSITDPFTNAVKVGGVQGILINGEHNNPVIKGNHIMHTGKQAAFTLATANGAAIRLSPAAGNSASIGGNDTNAALDLINLGDLPVARLLQ